MLYRHSCGYNSLKVILNKSVTNVLYLPHRSLVLIGRASTNFRCSRMHNYIVCRGKGQKQQFTVNRFHIQMSHARSFLTNVLHYSLVSLLPYAHVMRNTCMQTYSMLFHTQGQMSSNLANKMPLCWISQSSYTKLSLGLELLSIIIGLSKKRSGT